MDEQQLKNKIKSLINSCETENWYFDENAESEVSETSINKDLLTNEIYDLIINLKTK